MMSDVFDNNGKHTDVSAAYSASIESLESEYTKAENRIKKLEAALNEFVTEYCNREGEEDTPKTADEQECPLVANAMRLLDS